MPSQTPDQSPAHPHSRGENGLEAEYVAGARGSSPLTRGKPGREHHQLVQARLIPTHAGKTGAGGRGCPPSRAHPHSRGENWLCRFRGRGCPGSSPLTRGKPSIRWSVRPPVRAHPHSRGENCHARGLALSPRGSSPLTRGKRDAVPPRLVGVGLIPAHAGKTRADPRRSREAQAHPRSRGENSRGHGGGAIGAGSSPLTRGKPTWRLLIAQAGGLIPAHAGKTFARFGQAR